MKFESRLRRDSFFGDGEDGKGLKGWKGLKGLKGLTGRKGLLNTF